MISTISGNNSLEMNRQLKALTTAFIKEHGELAVESLDGSEVDLPAVLAATQSLPLLATKKLVVLRSLSSNKQLAESIEQIISSASTSVDLVFYEPNADKRTVFYKALKANTDFHEISELDVRELPSWLVARAQDLGGNLSSSDARYLVERVGANQQLLASELDKLIIFNPTVSRESIDLLSEKAPQSKVFDLMDAAFSGNKKTALAIYDEQRAQRVEPQEIMAMIAWQLRLITYAKLGQGKATDIVAKDASTSAYPLSKAQNLARKLELPKLVKLVEAAKEIDYKSKSQTYDLDEALKTYIIAI